MNFCFKSISILLSPLVLFMWASHFIRTQEEVPSSFPLQEHQKLKLTLCSTGPGQILPRWFSPGTNGRWNSCMTVPTPGVMLAAQPTAQLTESERKVSQLLERSTKPHQLVPHIWNKDALCCGIPVQFSAKCAEPPGGTHRSHPGCEMKLCGCAWLHQYSLDTVKA